MMGQKSNELKIKSTIELIFLDFFKKNGTHLNSSSQSWGQTHALHPVKILICNPRPAAANPDIWNLR